MKEARGEYGYLVRTYLQEFKKNFKSGTKAFESGEIDITSLPADLMDAYLNDPSIGVVEKANDMGYKLLINYERCPDFLELALRQGVYAAIDRQSVVDSVFRGAGTVGSAG